MTPEQVWQRHCWWFFTGEAELRAVVYVLQKLLPRGRLVRENAVFQLGFSFVYVNACRSMTYVKLSPSRAHRLLGWLRRRNPGAAAGFEAVLALRRLGAANPEAP